MATDSFLVSDEEYWQAVGVEYVPTLYIDGNATSFAMLEAKLRVREKVTECRGHADADGAVSTQPAVDIQTTGGTFVFNKYECSVSRRRVNDAGFWRYVVKEKWCALYVNGQRTCGADATAFRS